MEVIKKAITVVLSIILFEGPQLYTVDVVEIKNRIKLNNTLDLNLK